jgi:putative DNA primase/helicase
MFFRGYVATRNKRCLEKFKGVENLRSYDEVKNLNEYAGILDGQSILLDFDDSEQARTALKIVQDLDLKCRVYKTTRGVHILFKNSKVKRCGTGVKLACGLTADVKVGANAYSILKFDGKEREILRDSSDIQDVPRFFVPVRTKLDFLNMKKGEGRNQSLFNYILTLQSNGFSIDESRECLEVINKYVLAEPLRQSELETIMRDDAFSKPIFFNGKTFLFDKFSEYLKNNARIVKINGQLHIYENGIYVDSREKIESEMIQHIPNLNRAKRTEVLEYLNILIRDNKEQSPAHLIAFKNGIYNILDDELLPFSERYIITNKIDFNYNPHAESELVDATLDKLSCNDKEIRSLLEEAIGYCFYRRNELGKSFMLVGDGSRERGASNGKSTFLDMVKTLLGENNITSLDLSELNQKFQNAELFGKLANVGDDIDDNFIPNSAIFKKLVTGERIQVQRKGERPFEFNNYAKLLFSANEIPKIKDRGGAIQRRLVIVPFLAHFTKQDPDFRPYIKYELREPENIEYLIQLGIQGLKRILENQAFTESEKVKLELEEFEEANNPVVGFFKENPELQVENQTTTAIYNQYAEYCLANNHHAMSKIEFSKQVKKRFDMETKQKRVDGKVERVFVQK